MTDELPEAREFLRAYEKAMISDDCRVANQFLWQNCQTMVKIIAKQLGVIDVLYEALDDQEEFISKLEDEIQDR
jgi:hypothetical protein